MLYMLLMVTHDTQRAIGCSGRAKHRCVVLNAGGNYGGTCTITDGRWSQLFG
jgi:hypothetical protein